MILDENLFQDYRKPLKESAEAVKRILQPRVTKYGIKPFGKNEKLPRGFRFKSSSGTNGEVTYNGRDYVYAIKNGEVRVMDSSKAGHNWSETIYKESINESKSINEVNEGIDGWDNRTGVIKRIDKYLSDNPEAAPPKGYIQKGSRAYYDAVSRYGNYVTIPFGNISTEDLMQYARENGLLDEASYGMIKEKFKNKYLNESISLSEDQLDKAMELVDEIYEACKSIYSYNKNGKFEEGLNLNRWSIYAAAIDLHDLIEHESINESKPINEDARNKNSRKYFALMSYDFDPESGPDADSFSVVDIGQFSSKKEAEDNWRDILSEDQWAYVTEISEDEYNDHQELIKFYNEHPGYMDYEYYADKGFTQESFSTKADLFKSPSRAHGLDEEAFSGGYAGGGNVVDRYARPGASVQPDKKSYLGRLKNKNPDLVDVITVKGKDIKRGMITQSGQVKEAEVKRNNRGETKVYIMHTNNYDGFWDTDEDMEVLADPENKSKPFTGDYRALLKMGLKESVEDFGDSDFDKDADRHYPDRLKTKTYWYSTRHGVMPGSVPKGINILDVRDIGNKSYFKTDSIISSKDLKYYDIKEDIPPMEESKRSLKKHSRLLKENAYIKTFKLGDPEFENLYKLADILTKKSPNKYIYYVGDTYFDLGQDWMWTTVLCRGNWSSYQALNPREQEEAILANSDAELEKIADSVLSDKYCPDKKRISEDAIADKIRANQDTKEMTKRAIQILKKKGAEYKDLEKEYEKIYGDKLIFDEK